jgi:hypothetical protein
MIKTKEPPNAALGALTIEMASPRIAASAQEAMHPETEGRERKLVLFNRDPFHGYACSWCGYRFPESVISDRVSLFDKRHHFKLQREKEFSRHVFEEPRSLVL